MDEFISSLTRNEIIRFRCAEKIIIKLGTNKVGNKGCSMFEKGISVQYTMVIIGATT